METGEHAPEPMDPVEAESRFHLAKLDMADLADEPMWRQDGTPVVDESQTQLAANKFLYVCGEHARSQLRAFARLSPEDPQYDSLKQGLQSAVRRYFNPLGDVSEG